MALIIAFLCCSVTYSSNFTPFFWKVIGNKLFAFDFFLPQENRKLLEVKSINGIHVSNFIAQIEVNDLYDIEIGYRHCDIFARFGDEISKNPYDQGFYTSKGRFVDREKAAYIAMLAGQIDIEKCLSIKNVDGFDVVILKPLYSEDLY